MIVTDILNLRLFKGSNQTVFLPERYKTMVLVLLNHGNSLHLTRQRIKNL